MEMAAKPIFLNHTLPLESVIELLCVPFALSVPWLVQSLFGEIFFF